MPFDPVKVALARASGLSQVCSLCVKFWAAQDQNVSEAKCLALGHCGSPLAGDDFNQYEGPITDFRSHCFVCGEKSRFGLVVPGSLRVVGVCIRHVLLMNQLAPEKAEGTRIAEIRGPQGTVLSDQVVPPGRKSLAAAIKEAEDYFRKKNGEEDGG